MAFVQAGVVGFKFAATHHEDNRVGSKLNRLEVVREERLSFAVLALCGFIVRGVCYLSGFKQLCCDVEKDHAA